MGKYNIGLISTSRADRNLYGPLYAALNAANLPAYIIDASAANQGTPKALIIDAARIMQRVGACLDTGVYSLVFVLGDRPEMLAAAMAAVAYQIPIAHIAGGDITEGMPDEQCRHAISKLAHLHFVSLPRHAKRVIRMGEPPEAVHVTGSLSIDALRAYLASRKERKIEDIILCTIHPEPGLPALPRILATIESFGHHVLYTAPGHGPGEDEIKRDVTRSHGDVPVSYTEGMGADYYEAMMGARCMVGNSSSGIIEAASFCLPVVNCGHRQDGRTRPGNVIDVEWHSPSIRAAIGRALSAGFISRCQRVRNPYGDGHAAERIVEVIKNVDMGKFIRKKCRA